MNNIHRQLAEKLHSHWIKVKFYQQDPKLKGVEIPDDVRFCEATQMAIIRPVLLHKGNTSCPGASYVFGWRQNETEDRMQMCAEKMHTTPEILQALWHRIPQLPEPFDYIGLNTEGEPDLVISYLLPQQVMRLIKSYHSRCGENLEVALCGLMSICGCVAVSTYLTQRITLSFGCDDSRKYAKIGRDRVAVGIPKKLFPLFTEGRVNSPELPAKTGG